MTHSNLYGVSAEFSDAEGVTAAAAAAHKAGYRKMDAYTPYAVEGLDEALGMQPTRLGWVVLIVGITGVLAGFFMQLYANASHYPLNIGGRPYNSWPNFVVITFEFGVLFSAFAAGLFMLGRNGLPRPYHPMFNAPNFESATRDKFFLCIEADDPKFELQATRQFLEGLNPDRVAEVER